MQFKRFLAKSRIIDVKSADFKGVLSELFATIPDRLLGSAKREPLMQALIERENAISTYLESGICMPHVRIAGLKQKYIFAIGRCDHNVKFRENEEPKNLKMIFMILSDDHVESYMDTLSLFAKIFSTDADFIKQIKDAPDMAAFKAAVCEIFEKANPAPSATSRPQNAKGEKKGGTPKKKLTEEEKTNQLIIHSAVKIAKVAKCSTILIQADTFKNLPDLSKHLNWPKVVAVTDKPSLPIPSSWQIVNVRAFSSSRFSQLRSAMMIGITRGIFGVKEKICCLGGVLGSDKIDTIVILDIEKEYSDIFIGQKNMLPEGVKPEVIERVLDIATELSVEGREGKPVGCIFVIGDINELRPHIKQLILNPFYGYKPEDRNILNPFMDETVKEYSLIDGAFIIDGNGIIESAGSLIHTPDFKLQLPGGLGARHAAAYSISLMANCISLVVSSSTGQITLFRRGQMLPITEKKKE